MTIATTIDKEQIKEVKADYVLNNFVTDVKAKGWVLDHHVAVRTAMRDGSELIEWLVKKRAHSRLMIEHEYFYGIGDYRVDLSRRDYLGQVMEPRIMLSPNLATYIMKRGKTMRDNSCFVIIDADADYAYLPAARAAELCRWAGNVSRCIVPRQEFSKRDPFPDWLKVG